MNLLILGANSEIAHSLAKEFANAEHAAIYLASRDTDVLEKKAADMKIRFGVDAHALFFDALNLSSHRDFYESLNPKPDGVILAFGYLGDQKSAQNNFDEAQHIIDINLTGSVSILEIIAADFERRGHGFVIAIASVAGERGRQSNYIYGAAKGGLAIYLSGLRNRLCKRNVRVMTVLPGFVKTKMTESLELPEKLTASPEQAAQDIFRAYQKGKDIVYTKWFWRWIMLIIRLIPEKIFKRLSL